VAKLATLPGEGGVGVAQHCIHSEGGLEPGQEIQRALVGRSAPPPGDIVAGENDEVGLDCFKPLQDLSLERGTPGIEVQVAENRDLGGLSCRQARIDHYA
jgi:hypothetical protein